MARLISQKKKVKKEAEDKEKGVSRVLWLLLFVVLILAVMLVLPVFQNQEKKAEDYACTLAVRRAQEAVIVEYLSNTDLTRDQAAIVVDKTKLTDDNLCPSGGDYFLVQENGAWRVMCGLHEDDTSLRTRTNAAHVLEMLEEHLEARRRLEMSLDEAGIILILNGAPLDVIRLAGDNGLRRGTDYSIDFDGVVCFFSLNDEGDIAWFVYADPNHAAVWKRTTGWSGDAYPKK